VDYRGVFLNTDLSSILGITSGVRDNIVKQNDAEDSAFWELRRFFKLLQGGNTQAVELLYLGDENNFDMVDPLFMRMALNRTSLYDSDKLFKVLKGYAQAERMLANGERTGKLGGKRRESLDKYGFSPKNFVQLFRLLWAGNWLYNLGVFPVNVRRYDEGFASYLMKVKTQPETCKREDLNLCADMWEERMTEAFNNTKYHYTFDVNLANRLCYEAYMPLLQEITK
jgi:predicted nucleotidyltransferase